MARVGGMMVVVVVAVVTCLNKKHSYRPRGVLQHYVGGWHIKLERNLNKTSGTKTCRSRAIHAPAATVE